MCWNSIYSLKLLNQHTSFNSLKLIAENVSTKSEALQLVCVVVD
ncbi:unnamed protein product [Brassica oleracea var. botrytis]|uniref:Uncharacterized protein n=1 Tax=Brassica oleracea TaxID=3712 RepID=A0A3P6GM45_BRAOL|nr:unnamed protein product [Brassica oleracea]